MTTQLRDRRALVIKGATFLGGVYFFLYFIFPQSVLERMRLTPEVDEAITTGFLVVLAMAFGLGIINLVRAHGGKVLFRQSGWSNSVVLLIGLGGMFAITTAQWWHGVQLSYQLRAVRTIGDFSARIVADSEDSARQAQVLPVPERVAALLRYAGEQLAAIRVDVAVRQALPRAAAEQEGVVVEQALERTLLSEVVATEAHVTALAGVDRSTFPGAAKEHLMQIAAAGQRLAGAFSAWRQHCAKGALPHRLYTFFYTGLFNHLASAMFALLGVYIAAAAYRAFRVRSVESGLMMAAAVVVIVGQVSFVAAVWPWLGQRMPELRQWLLEVPNSAAFRAIRLGSAVAGLLLAVRMWLSLDRSTAGGRK